MVYLFYPMYGTVVFFSYKKYTLFSISFLTFLFLFFLYFYVKVVTPALMHAGPIELVYLK